MRYVGKRDFDENTGVVNGSAFQRRPIDTDGLSVIRRYFFSNDSDADIAEIRTVISTYLSVNAAARLVEINVGNAIQRADNEGVQILCIADPLPASGSHLANPAHAILEGLPIPGEEPDSLKAEIIGDAIRRAVLAVHHAKA